MHQTSPISIYAIYRNFKQLLIMSYVSPNILWLSIFQLWPSGRESNSENMGEEDLSRKSTTEIKSQKPRFQKGQLLYLTFRQLWLAPIPQLNNEHLFQKETLISLSQWSRIVIMTGKFF